MNPIDDSLLAARLASPDTRREAFSEVIAACQEQLYWQIRRLVVNHDDTADVLQNTLLKAWQGLDSFRGDSKLSTWLYTIAQRESITFLQKMQAERELTLDDPEGYVQDQLEASDFTDGQEVQRLLLEAIATLPVKQRQVFNMRYFDDMPYDEMSAVLGTSVGALKASYHFAAEKIAAYIRRKEVT